MRPWVLTLVVLLAVPAQTLFAFPQPLLLDIRCSETDGQLVITHVAPSGLGEMMKLAEGDTILSINGTPVRSTGDMREALASSRPLEGKESRHIEIKLTRGGQRVVIAGTVRRSERVAGKYVFRSDNEGDR